MTTPDPKVKALEAAEARAHMIGAECPIYDRTMMTENIINAYLSALNTDEMVERVGTIISGAPFPSKRSLAKARAVLAEIGIGEGQ